MWTILVIPVLIVLFAVVVEGVHLWLARVELENGLEAAALAAVKEWAESGASPGLGWTDVPRTIGQEYAAANTINQTPITIDKNLAPGPYDPANPNENRTCDIDDDGNLIFGAITEVDPYVFEADKVPSCAGGGRVLADVTSDNMDSADNSWGISFPTEDDPLFNQTVRIRRIVIDVDPNDTGQLRFNFDPSDGLPPRLSDNNPQATVQGLAPNIFNNLIASKQHDNYGFLYWFNTTSPSNWTLTEPDGVWPNLLGTPPPHTSPQIVFSYVADAFGITEVLTIDFFPYDDGMGNSDLGFNPGDRFRFGAGVERSNQGGNWSTANGDDIGAAGVEITVFFEDINGNPLEPLDGAVGVFSDTEFSSNNCANKQHPGEWEQDDLGNYHLLVHPIRLLSPGVTPLIARDLPCPLTSAANNDKQSIVLALGGVGQGYYAVRAQARHQVPSLICGFCGINFGPFHVAACTTAMYDCELRRPRLIRVEPENYFCPTRP